MYGRDKYYKNFLKSLFINQKGLFLTQKGNVSPFFHFVVLSWPYNVYMSSPSLFFLHHWCLVFVLLRWLIWVIFIHSVYSLGLPQSCICLISCQLLLIYNIFWFVIFSYNIFCSVYKFFPFICSRCISCLRRFICVMSPSFSSSILLI